jgi:hypothetical protein
LTDLCQAEGKQFYDWRRTDWAEKYLYELSIVTGIPVTVLIDTRQGGRAADQGTWGHPRVTLRVAQWCSPSLAVAVDTFLEEWITRGHPQTTALLAHYLAPALRPWGRRFEREFYAEIYRLWGKFDEFPPDGQSTWGIWTAPILDRLIYARIFPPVVMQALRLRNPRTPSGGRRHRHMQLLAEDLGDKELQRGIDFTLHFLRVARDPEHLWLMLDTVRPLRQSELPFPDNFRAGAFARQEVP